jgi:hypothetical protein
MDSPPLRADFQELPSTGPAVGSGPGPGSQGEASRRSGGEPGTQGPGAGDGRRSDIAAFIRYASSVAAAMTGRWMPNPLLPAIEIAPDLAVAGSPRHDAALTRAEPRP